VIDELLQVKQNYEALLQREEEEKAGQCSPPERPWHRESQEATWALLKVKDRLIEVERNVSLMMEAVSRPTVNLFKYLREDFGFLEIMFKQHILESNTQHWCC